MNWTTRDLERVEKFEVLILHVLPDVRGDAMCGEQPVRVTRASAVEAESHRGIREPRHDPGLEVHLQRQHDIKSATREGMPHVGERPPPLQPVEHNDFVDEGMTTHQCRRSRLQHPGHPHRRQLRFECVNDRHHMHGIANGTHHDDRDVIEMQRWERRRGRHAVTAPEPVCVALRAVKASPQMRAARTR